MANKGVSSSLMGCTPLSSLAYGEEAIRSVLSGLWSLGADFWLAAVVLVSVANAAGSLDLATLLGAVAVVELLFVVLNWWRISRLGRRQPWPAPAQEDVDLSFQKMMRDASLLDRETVIRYQEDWFFGVPLHTMRKGNIEDLLAYGFYNSERPLAPDSREHGSVSEMARKLLRLTRVTLKPGRSPIKFRDHLQSKLKAWHYPLVFYVATEFFGYLTHIGLLLMGFAKHKLNGTAYFVYEPLRPREKSLAPIFFFHGIGMGITPYFRFIYRLMMLGHPVVLVEHRHVSMRLCFSCPTVDDCVDTAVSILDRQGYKKSIVVSHSYGTLVSSRLLRLHSERIQAMCLVDPVCCSMHNPKLLKNFVYRGVDYKNVVNALVTAVTLAIARDPGISSAVSRGFRWPDLNLWPDLVDKNSMFVLSGKDNMVPIGDIQVQYRTSGVNIMCHPEHIHGSFIGDKAWQQTIIEQFKLLPGVAGDSQLARVIS